MWTVSLQFVCCFTIVPDTPEVLWGETLLMRLKSKIHTLISSLISSLFLWSAAIIFVHLQWSSGRQGLHPVAMVRMNITFHKSNTFPGSTGEPTECECERLYITWWLLTLQSQHMGYVSLSDTNREFTTVGPPAKADQLLNRMGFRRKCDRSIYLLHYKLTSIMCFSSQALFF